MKISEAHTLLSEDGVADHARYFNDLYKQHEFKESDDLKNYFEFVLHEPELWLKSFPNKLKSKPAFSKPKTAILKLLRNNTVISEYGKTFCEHAHDVIDSVYKKNVDGILELRKDMKSEECIVVKEDGDYEVQPIPNKISHIVDYTKTEQSKTAPQLIIQLSEDIEEIPDIESVVSHPVCKKSEVEDEYRELQKRYRTLKKAYEELAKGTLHPSVVCSIQTLMSMI
jgi:hypothetical protein